MAKLSPDYIKWVLTLDAKQAQEELHKLEKDNRELQKQNTATRKAMTQLEAEGKKGSQQWQNLRNSIRQNSQAMADNRSKIQEITKGMDLSALSVSNLRKRLNQLKKEFNNTAKATDPKRYKELRSEITRVQGAIDKANASARGLRAGFFSLTKAKQTFIGFFNGIGMAIMGLITGAFADAFRLIVDFEKANSRLASILGTSREGIKEMEAAARQLGATTSYSAAQVTNLQIELAKLGFGKDQILAMEDGILKFAKAVDTDLASASAFAGAALRIFNKDARDTEDVLATFAVATTKTALDFSKLQTSLSIVGPVANAFGLSIEDTTALLGQLANAGFDASSAATATRNIILKLCDANGDLAKALGGPVHNAEDLAAGLQKLNAEGVDLAKALELTDKRSVAAFSTFLSQAGNLTALRDSITGVTDDFNKMSKTMGDNVAGAMAGLRSAAEELVMKLTDGAEGPTKIIIQGLTAIVQGIGNLIVAFEPAIGFLKLMGSRIVEIGKITYNNFLKPLTDVGSAAKTILIPTINTLVAALVSYKVAVIATVTWTKIQNSTLAARLIALKSQVTWTNLATVATQAWNTALKSNIFGLIAGLVVGVGTAIYSFVKGTEEAVKKTNYLTTATENYKKALTEADAKLAMERDRLLELQKVARNELETKEHRIKAINELNRIVPGYNASLNEETGRYIENANALEIYIKSLEKKLRLEAAKGQYSELLEADNKEQLSKYKEWKNRDFKKEMAFVKSRLDANPDWQNYDPTGFARQQYKLYQELQEQSEMTFTEWYQKQNTEQTQALNEFKSFLGEAGMSLEDIAKNELQNTTDNISQGLNNVGNSAHSVTDEVKQLKTELKELRKMEPETDEEFYDIQDRKKKIQTRLKVLNGTDSKKGRHTPGTYAEDSLDEATAAADDTHQRKLLDINKLKGDLPEYDIIIKKNEELIRYSGDLIKALENLRAKTDATHTATLDKIQVRENKIGQDILAARQAIDKATAQKEQTGHENRLRAYQKFYDTQEQTVKRALMNQENTEGEAEIYLLARKKDLHESQLKELKDYYRKTENADYLGAEQKRQQLEKLADDIRSMESQVLTDTGNFSERLRTLYSDTTSADGIRNTFEMQRRDIEATYAAAIKYAGEGTDMAVKLEEEKKRRLGQLDFEYLEQQYQLKELTGLTWQDEYSRELAQLQNYHRQGLISETQYQRRRLELGVTSAKKYFDYYSQLSGSMFAAIQEAEIARSDAKYDVLIQQAKNNGEETAALEQEKENSKLEIQKKYADVNFAIKISQIVADTAVAVMKAYADLGWIGGSIAAAMITATGIAQGVAAKAERDKVKNMQPGNVSGAASEGAAAAERKLTGYSEGGYTGDGGRYEVAGVVHKGEYVVPKPIMRDARVMDAVGMIEAIRLSRRGAVSAPGAGGFAEGGYTSGDNGGAAAALIATQDLRQAAAELRTALGRGIRAFITFRDMESAANTMERARNPFTRNK